MVQVQWINTSRTHGSMNLNQGHWFNRQNTSSKQVTGLKKYIQDTSSIKDDVGNPNVYNLNSWT